MKKLIELFKCGSGGLPDSCGQYLDFLATPYKEWNTFVLIQKKHSQLLQEDLLQDIPTLNALSAGRITEIS